MINVKLNNRGKKLFISMSKFLPRFVDAITISLFIEKLKATNLSARTKRKIMKNIKKKLAVLEEAK